MKFAVALLLSMISAQEVDEQVNIEIGQSGYASTTRYWDCSGGACGCGFGNPSKPVHCHSNAMFLAPDNNPYGARFYGSAALSQQLGGGNWLASGCGKCFKVTGTSNIGNHKEKTVVVLKGTNYCPPSNSVCAGQAHFDIAAPGFDYPPASQSNTCSSSPDEKEHALKGDQPCGWWMIHSQNPSQNCNCNAFHDTTLKEGCSNFKSLYWNNPRVHYEVIECPSELRNAPPCWNQNGEHWPKNAPTKCEAAYGLTPPDEETTEVPTADVTVSSDQEAILA